MRKTKWEADVSTTECRNCGIEFQSSNSDKCPKCGTKTLDCQHEWLDEEQKDEFEYFNKITKVRRCKYCGKTVSNDKRGLQK